MPGCDFMRCDGLKRQGLLFLCRGCVFLLHRATSSTCQSLPWTCLTCWNGSGKKNNNPASFLLLFPNSISFCYFSELNWLAKCFSRQRESGMKAAFPFWWQRAAWSAPMAVKSQHWPPPFNATAAILGAGVLQQSPSSRTAVETWGHVQWVHWVSCLGGENFTSSKGVVIKTMKICMMSSALISLINPFSFFIASFIKWRLENDLKGFKN